MIVMDPLEAIVFIGLGLGSWVIFFVALVIIPLRSYLITGKVWGLSPTRMSFIVLEGKKARQNLILRSILIIGLLDLVVSMILFDRFAWEGALVIFASFVFGFFTTHGAKRVPRKKFFWLRKFL
jgi:hypothetical protein